MFLGFRGLSFASIAAGATGAVLLVMLLSSRLPGMLRNSDEAVQNQLLGQTTRLGAACRRKSA